jgi:hypothetical protein
MGNDPSADQTREAPTVVRESPAGPSGGGDLTEQLLTADWWTDAMVEAAGIPIVDVPLVMVGGGIGSFVTSDYLRIAGVTTDRIRILSDIDHPWQTYEYLTRVSQIPRPERIRSDSASRPDNIWGFPSYALAEAFRDRSLKSLRQVFLEPMWADFYTPRAGQVFTALEREMKRISYQDMLVKGQVRMIRRRHGGGYFTILTPPDATPARRVAYRSQFVHLAVGYPGLKFLPELQNFRTENQDFYHVVSAYEDHEHVYDRLRVKRGVVLIRGGGIVSSRVLQRLMDDRAKNQLSTEIVHLFRTYINGPHGPGPWMRRKGSNGFAYQGFNYPKSVWGGQLKAKMRRLEGDQRAAEYKLMGGTNTPWRRSWQRQMNEGRAAGWYRVLAGTVEQMKVREDGMVVSQVKTAQGPAEIAADFVIDCTGLEADIAEHRVLADLLEHSGAGRNPVGRLDVERSFELRGTSSAPGTIYASGASTLGGYFPGVDTFLGLQIAAQEITDDLARRGFCPKIGPARSTRQWLRWVLGNQP